MTDAPNSDALLPRIANGDPDAVGACLQRYSALVWSLARKFWTDVATIEDVVQEIFIELWRCADRYDPQKASEATFIATIARRRMIDRRRRTSRAPSTEDVMDQEIGERDESLDHVEISDEARLAREALDQLRPEQRKVILMSVVDGLTHPEIASKTGLPLGTVKSHIRRGLDKAAQLVRSKQPGQVQK
jgi:RNA polymerase sigma-70 factor (ECF subfamily)